MVHRASGEPDRCAALAEQAARRPAILPSLLLCDFGNLEREVRALESAGVPALHLDVMDGHFVPNLTYGMPIVKALRELTELPLDVHLMIENPGRYVEVFRDAGADILTVHGEVLERPREVLQQIRSIGCAAGLAMNPSTPVSAIKDLLGECDLVLVMSVEPGFGGQAFDPVSLDKLREVRARAGRSVLVEVDGGINAENIGTCAAAGADLFVVGSAIFRSDDYADAIKRLSAAAASSAGKTSSGA